jgi:hypothetical protein
MSERSESLNRCDVGLPEVVQEVLCLPLAMFEREVVAQYNGTAPVGSSLSADGVQPGGKVEVPLARAVEFGRITYERFSYLG